MTGYLNPHGPTPCIYPQPIDFAFAATLEEADEMEVAERDWVAVEDLVDTAQLWSETDEDRFDRIHGRDDADPAFHEDYYFEENHLCREQALEGVALNGEVIRHNDERFSEKTLRFEAMYREFDEEGDLVELTWAEEDAWSPTFHGGPLEKVRLNWIDQEWRDWGRRWFKAESRGTHQQRAPRWQQRCRTNRMARLSLRDLPTNDNLPFAAEDFLDAHVAFA